MDESIHPRYCLGQTHAGKRCRRRRWENSDGWYCHHHEWQIGVEEPSRG